MVEDELATTHGSKPFLCLVFGRPTDLSVQEAMGHAV